MTDWYDINVFHPPENKRVLVCYKVMNRVEVGVFHWIPVGHKKIWIGSIKENQILFWAKIGDIPFVEPIKVNQRFNLSPINNRFEILDIRNSDIKE